MNEINKLNGKSLLAIWKRDLPFLQISGDDFEKVTFIKNIHKHIF